MELTENYKMFNTHHSSMRVVVECTFGILKAKFKELDNETKLRVQFVPEVIKCCAILHNFLIQSKDKSVNRNLPPRVTLR